MAERRAHCAAAVPQSLLPGLLPFAAAAMLLAAQAAQAQWTVSPAVGLSTTYSDNIELRDDDLASAQWVSEVRPSINIVGRSQRLNVNANAAWNQYAYSKKDDMALPSDSQHRYSANLQGTVVDQLLYVDAGASRNRRSIQAFGPNAEDNPYTNANQTDVKAWRISPYLVRRVGSNATLQVRYTHDSVDSGERDAFGSSTGDTVMVNLASGASLSAFGWGLSYVRSDLDNRLVGESSSELANASLRYQFSRTWAATATAGYDRYDFEGPGSDNGGRSWTIGGAWNPSTRTSVQASFGRHLYGNTGTLAATLRTRRTAWDIQYGDTITNTRSQFLLPASIDTAAMLDRLFNSIIADPLERERAVAAYMLANGLPASLANSINYLSNRYARVKQLRGSFAWRNARATAVVSAYRSESVALSDQQSDSPLLGSSLSSLNDNVRQRGADASLVYRLSAKSNMTLGGDYRFSESRTTSIDSVQRTLYARLSRNLGRHATASLEARRRSGNTTFSGNRDYTENALVANLTMTY